MKNFLFKPIPIIGFVIILLSSCSTAKIFSSPDARELASKQQMVAIIPSVISIAAKGKVTADVLQEQQRTESLNFQKEIHSWILNRKMQGKITVEIQDVETTNAEGGNQTRARRNGRALSAAGGVAALQPAGLRLHLRIPAAGTI